MTIDDAMKLPSFENASVIAGQQYTKEMNITGIMVLEALDIENWAHAGEMILSSYYALNTLTETELCLFIKKMSSIKIAALIIKLDRLLKEIPKELIMYCDLYHIPLITVSNTTSYENLILEILRPLINTKADALDRYYQIHRKLSLLMLQEPSISQLLEELCKTLHCDVTLITDVIQEVYGTNPELNQFQVLQKQKLPFAEHQIFQHYLLTVSYDSDASSTPHPCTSVFIPSSEDNAATLYIHSAPEAFHNDFFPIIENFVFFLQTELLKQSAIRRNLFLQTNEFVYNLLEQKQYDTLASENILRHLHLLRYAFYQVVTVHFQIKETPHPDRTFESTLSFQFCKLFCAKFHKYCPVFSYGQRENHLVLICNIPNPEKLLTSGQLKEIMQSMQQDFPDQKLRYQVALSSVKQRTELTMAYQETLDILKILEYKNDPQGICSYGEFGIYRLLLKADVLDHIESIIPAEFLSFHRQHPELSETLRCYLAHNQSITETAKAMFLHPKTISYRVNRIKELLTFNLKDNDSVIELQIAYHALDLQKKGASS